MLALLARISAPGIIVIWGLRASAMLDSHYDLMSRAARKAEAIISRFADWHVVNSVSGMRDAVARGFPSERMSVIPNGIDLERFRPDPDARKRNRLLWGVENGTIIIGHVARIDPMKDHSTFFEALAQLNATRSDFRAVCVAIGP